mgnify:CR=1 FL=1
MSCNQNLVVAHCELIENIRQVSCLRRMLIKFRFFAPEYQCCHFVIIRHRQLLKQSQEIAPLKTMSHAFQTSSEAAVAPGPVRRPHPTAGGLAHGVGLTVGDSADSRLSVRLPVQQSCLVPPERRTHFDCKTGMALGPREEPLPEARSRLDPHETGAGDQPFVALATDRNSRGGLAAGGSVGRGSDEGLITSARLVGSEAAPGLGRGGLAWADATKRASGERSDLSELFPLDP